MQVTAALPPAQGGIGRRRKSIVLLRSFQLSARCQFNETVAAAAKGIEGKQNTTLNVFHLV